MKSDMSSVTAQADYQPEVLWRNGTLIPWSEAVVHVNAVGHASVSGVFEGIKAYWNVEQDCLWVFRLEDHMRQFEESMQLVHLESGFTSQELVQATVELLRANDCRTDTYIRPWSFVRGVVRELIAPAGVPTETLIDTWPFHSRMHEGKGCRVCISSWRRIGSDVVPVRAKAFANYHNGRMGLVDARSRGFDWPIFLNANSCVTEAPGACIIAVKDGLLRTPRLTDGVLAGITRDTVLTLARHELALPVEETAMLREDLQLADELFFVGTGWEILPIVEVDGLAVGSGERGLITHEFQRLYHDIVRGVADSRREWLTEIAF